jgi:hypothetical protein
MLSSNAIISSTRESGTGEDGGMKSSECLLAISSWRLCLVAAVALTMCGCGRPSNLEPVAGKVTFQGKPVTAGIVRFTNAQAGVDMTATLKPDGSYEFVLAQGKGLPAGNYQIAVMPPRIDAPLGPKTAPPKPQVFPDIPQKYRLPTTSGLTAEIPAKTASIDIMLTP